MRKGSWAETFPASSRHTVIPTLAASFRPDRVNQTPLRETEKVSIDIAMRLRAIMQKLPPYCKD